MYFRRLLLKNYGPFEKLEINFRPKGLNIIEGLNCTGKSQIAGAFLAAIIGKPALHIYKDGKLPALIELDIQENDHHEKIILTIDNDFAGNTRASQSIESKSTTDKHKRLAFEIMASLSDPDAAQIFYTQANNQVVLTQQELDLFDKIINKNPTLKKDWDELQLQPTLTARTRSAGENAVSSIIKTILDRATSKKSLPLIIDSDHFAALDQRKLNLCKALAETLTKNTQIIYFTNTLTNNQPELIVKQLPQIDYDIKNAVFYNGFLTQPAPLRTKKAPSKFILGAKIRLQEDRTREFKEIKGAQPINSIKSLADQYVVAFLNAGRPQKGSIYWGICDSEQRVVGVKLSTAECDELRRIVTEKLHQITPPIAPTAYSIQLHEISNGREILQNLYVVEIAVPSSRRTLLYATGSQDVYIKTDAGKKKLTIQEIQQELLARVGIESY